MTAALEIKNITHRFGDFTALKQVNLSIAAGSFAVLLGPSGCGKTTLLSTLGGFLTPSHGQILIGGRDVTHVPPAKRPTTTMFQDYALFPHMSLGANVGFGLRMRGVNGSKRNARAEQLLRLVGLEDAFDKKPHELSGGQRQRVALARSLAVEPEVLLLDEPLGALDLKLRRQMQEELKAIQRRIGTTFIHVTHDQEEAMAIADEIIVMNQGEVQDQGSPEQIYLRPKSRFSAAFMGEANFVSGHIKSVDGGVVVVVSPFGQHGFPSTSLMDDNLGRRAHVELCFRPEHLRTGKPPKGTLDLGQAVVNDLSFFGTHYRCQMALDTLEGVTVIAHLPQSAQPMVHGRIPMYLDPVDMIILRGGDK